MLNRSSSAPGNEAPDEQHDHRAHDCSDEPGSLISVVPAHSLAQISRDKGSDNSEKRRENKSGWLVVPRRDEFRDHTCDEADDDRPYDVHGASLARTKTETTTLCLSS